MPNELIVHFSNCLGMLVVEPIGVNQSFAEYDNQVVEDFVVGSLWIPGR